MAVEMEDKHVIIRFTTDVRVHLYVQTQNIALFSAIFVITNWNTADVTENSFKGGVCDSNPIHILFQTL